MEDLPNEEDMELILQVTDSSDHDDSGTPISHAKAVTHHAKSTRTRKLTQDSTESTLGSARSILNWLCDTGATAHMTPRLADLVHVEEVPPISVEVADGHTVQVNQYGKCELQLTDQHG